MAKYLLTTDTIAPADFEAYVSCQRRAFAGPPGNALAAWIPKFGTPNQMTMVQQAAGPTDPPDALTIPPGTRLLTRACETVDIIRPFPASLGERPLCEMRTYRTAPEFWDEFLALKTANLPLRERYSPSFGVFAAASGVACRVMHLWGYGSLDERDAVRAQLRADPAWGDYIARILPMLVEMQSILITPILPD